MSHDHVPYSVRLVADLDADDDDDDDNDLHSSVKCVTYGQAFTIPNYSNVQTTVTNSAGYAPDVICPNLFLFVLIVKRARHISVVFS